MIDWTDVDRILKVASVFILTDEERESFALVEQSAYDSNIPRIQEILKEHEGNLKTRGFWTELQIENKGLRFRYSYPGFYGPGGFSSQFHVSGPLVLGKINPKGDPIASFYPNNLDENTFLGDNFDELAFNEFIADDLMNYLAPKNQILSKEQYRWIQDLLNLKTNE